MSSASAQESGTKPPADPRQTIPAARAEAMKNNDGSSDRVFGGSEAEPGQWPFQVALLDTGRLEENPETQFQAQFCGGSLISPQWILTAAHCVTDNNGSPYNANTNTVLVGATKLVEGKRHIAAEVIVHEGYDPATIENDIALIKLAEPTDAPSVKLSETGTRTESGTATLTGWGVMEDGSTPLNLMQVELNVVPNATCNTGIKGYFRQGLEQTIREQATFIHLSENAIVDAVRILDAGMGDPLGDGMLCAGVQSGAKSSCNGDSGGPLSVPSDGGPVQIGVVSWGSGPLGASRFCGHPDAYAVYTRVSSYRDWIKEKSGI